MILTFLIDFFPHPHAQSYPRPNHYFFTIATNHPHDQVCWVPDMNVCITGSWDKRVCVWDGRTSTSTPQHTMNVSGQAESPLPKAHYQ